MGVGAGPRRPVAAALPDGRSVEVRVRVSSRARHARLVVAPGAPPEAVLPVRAPAGTLELLLARRGGWLAARLDELAARRDRAGVLGMERPGLAWIDGRPLPIAHRAGAPARAALAGGGVRVGGAPASAVGAVERLLRAEARRRLEAAVAAGARRLGVAVGRVSLRDPRTRWGSCSARGDLSFSWRLVMAPAPVRDAVVAHELCHRIRHDHSPAFWRELDAARPGWRAEWAWLRDHGHELLAYRVALSR